MPLRVLPTFVFLLALTTLANAQTWTSPDGFLLITPPDPSQFQAMPTPPPPFVALWVSNDETMKFGVMQTPIPANIEILQSSAEEGLAEEIGGKVTRLPTKQVSGHEVWTMTGNNDAIEITQAILRHENAIYKLMAVTVGGKPDADAVNRFFDSLAIVQAAPIREDQPATEAAEDLGGGIDFHDLSKKIGGASLLLFSGLVVFLVMRGKKNREA